MNKIEKQYQQLKNKGFQEGNHLKTIGYEEKVNIKCYPDSHNNELKLEIRYIDTVTKNKEEKTIKEFKYKHYKKI